MPETEFVLESSGQGARAMVGPALAKALAEALDVPGANASEPLFQACMAWLHTRKDSFAGQSNISGLHPHFAYYLKNLAERQIDPVAIWSRTGTNVAKGDMGWLKIYLPEFLNHITNGVLGWKPGDAAPPGNAPHMVSIYTQLRQRTAIQSTPRLRDHVPYTIIGLPSEANLNVLFPKFEESLAVAGDICEFGCFRGVTSIKMAFLAKAAGCHKTVYAFDTFEGFQISDPGGGALGIGAFGDNFDAFGELTRWGKVLPIVPVKGDATQTCKVITAPLSFVWLDLDMGVLMDPVLNQIWPYIGKDTIIGIDDVGRPETPTVEPWVNEVMKSGRLVEISRHDNEFIRFYRRA